MMILRKVIFPVLTGIFLLVLAACGGDSEGAGGTGPAGETRDSQIRNFTLENLTIPVGTTVTWTNLDSTAHTSTSGDAPDFDGVFDSSILKPNDTFSHTFSSAGTFPYWCRLHPTSMIGLITVQ